MRKLLVTKRKNTGQHVDDARNALATAMEQGSTMTTADQQALISISVASSLLAIAQHLDEMPYG